MCPSRRRIVVLCALSRSAELKGQRSDSADMMEYLLSLSGDDMVPVLQSSITAPSAISRSPSATGSGATQGARGGETAMSLAIATGTVETSILLLTELLGGLDRLGALDVAANKDGAAADGTTKKAAEVVEKEKKVEKAEKVLSFCDLNGPLGAVHKGLRALSKDAESDSAVMLFRQVQGAHEACVAAVERLRGGPADVRAGVVLDELEKLITTKRKKARGKKTKSKA